MMLTSGLRIVLRLEADASVAEGVSHRLVKPLTRDILSSDPVRAVCYEEVDARLVGQVDSEVTAGKADTQGHIANHCNRCNAGYSYSRNRPTAPDD
ncbi:MAG: hypothetical protein GY724_25890 [Actinomycetia bacterium]|nr:hypothetical protein [Actinomycetes bacterium]